MGKRRSWSRGQDSEQGQAWELKRGLLAACDCGRVCDCGRDCHCDCGCVCHRQSFRGVRKEGSVGWRGSWCGGQDTEQERTLQQERGLLATCDCGRNCDCDRNCHYSCDRAWQRRRVR